MSIGTALVVCTALVLASLVIAGLASLFLFRKFARGIIKEHDEQEERRKLMQEKANPYMRAKR